MRLISPKHLVLLGLLASQINLLAQTGDTLAHLSPKEKVSTLNKVARKSISSDPISSLNYSREAATLAQSIDDTSGHALATKLAGNINYMLGNYTEALGFFLDSYLLYEQLQDTLSMAGLRGSAGLVYKATEEYTKSLESYEEAHQLLVNSSNDGIKAKLYNNQGVIYRRLQDFDKALEYFERSLAIKERIDDKKGVANSYTNLGNVSADKKDYQKAFDFFFKSLAIEEALESDEGMAKNLNNIANLYYIQSDYGQAITFATRGLEIGERLGTKIQIKEASQILADSYFATANYRKAYESFRQFHAANDSLYNEEEARKIGRLESKLDLEKKQRELEQSEQANVIAQIEIEQKRTQQLFIITIGLMVVIALVFIAVTQKQKSKLREKALLSELSELRIEIKTLIGKYEGSLDVSLEDLNEKLVNPLSEREYDVFKQIFSQKTNSEIAEELYVSINTVKTHLKNLYSKLGVTNRKEALNIIFKP